MGSKYLESASIGLLGLSIRVPQTEWIKQGKSITSQFWRPEVRDQGACRVGSFGGL